MRPSWALVPPGKISQDYEQGRVFLESETGLGLGLQRLHVVLSQISRQISEKVPKIACALRKK